VRFWILQRCGWKIEVLSDAEFWCLRNVGSHSTASCLRTPEFWIRFLWRRFLRTHVILLQLSQEGRPFVGLLSDRLSIINVLSNTMNCGTRVSIMHCSCIKSLSLNLLRCTFHNAFCIACSLHFSRSEVTSFLPLETGSAVRGACVSGSRSRPSFSKILFGYSEI